MRLGVRVGLGLGVGLSLLAASGCRSDVRLRTRAFVAPAPCGQGPYDIHLRADGTTGGDGVEIVACTPRRLAGHVVFRAGDLELANRTYGDLADNQRCVGGRPTAVTAIAKAGTGTAEAAGPAGPAGRNAAAPALVERPFGGSETPFADELCGRLGLAAQQILISTLLTRTTSSDVLGPGGDLHIRLWSDVPNDLEGVVFMIRQVTSTRTPAQVERELAERDRRRDRDPPVQAASPPRPDHGPPPAPLVEERPPAPGALAVWTPGYWTWTGSAWGWIAGSWRDDRVALPAPRVELPGPPPRPGAIWIGGTWQLRAGAHVWISGRWRR
jgi:hypothetical protein